jgi:phytoene dehydrogenase-like protein
MFSASPAWDAKRAPAGKRAVTVSLYTDAAEWFGYHTDETEHETQDQQMLEACWERLHAALPELGAGVEVIETATPRTFYEGTRRKLGMTGGIPQTLANSRALQTPSRTARRSRIYTPSATRFSPATALPPSPNPPSSSRTRSRRHGNKE